MNQHFEGLVGMPDGWRDMPAHDGGSALVLNERPKGKKLIKRVSREDEGQSPKPQKDGADDCAGLSTFEQEQQRLRRSIIEKEVEPRAVVGFESQTKQEMLFTPTQAVLSRREEQLAVRRACCTVS